MARSVVLLSNSAVKSAMARSVVLLSNSHSAARAGESAE